jgi:hypothetical protein
MLVTDQYLYLPGCCGICRSNNLPTIDTGMSLDHPGDPNGPNPSANSQFYICADCAIELARMVIDSRGLEFCQAGYRGSVEATIDNLTESNVALAQRVEELENAIMTINTVVPVRKEAKSSPAKKNFKVASPEGVDL